MPQARQNDDHGVVVLVIAAVVSALFHALLILLVWLFGLLPSAAGPTEIPEQTIKFSFAEPSEIDQPADTGGAVTPPPLPEPLPPSEPAPEVPSPVEEPPLEPVAPPESAEDSTRQEADDDADTEVAEFPVDDARPVDPRPTRREPASKPIDIDRAIRDFGRALDRARAAAPPQPPRPESEPRNTFAPDPAAIPGSGFGVGNLRFESSDYDWSDYARQIYMAIWRAWHNRLYESADDFEKWAYQTNEWMLDHSTSVRFVIEGSGEVTEISIELISGCPPLDASAADALDEVILPPLPPDFPRNREVVHARFVAVGELLALRPTVTRLKRLGYF
ncbi:MAG: hypothetical protein GY716_06510 [bacterium]|nr:hypothetical protein [bacterium]